MIMIILNLLPNHLKAEHTHRRWSSFIILFVIINLFLLVIGIILVVSNLFLANSVRDLTGKILLGVGDYKETAIFNREINHLQDAQQKFIIYSDLFAPLASLTPSDITVKKIDINGTENSIRLEGITQKRSSLFQFEDRLEESDRFSNAVTSSIVDIAGGNFLFTLTASLELSKL